MNHRKRKPTLREPKLSPFGRAVVFGPHSRCGCCRHAYRILAVLVDSLGRRHAADWCANCGGRTECISRSDLEAAGINWMQLPEAVRADGRVMVLWETAA